MKICLLSSERSGSNLLRLMLNNHPEVSAPSAPQIARILGPILHLYGDLSDDVRMQKLLENMISLTKVHPHPWDIELNVNRIEQRMSERTFWHAYDAVFSTYAADKGKPNWCSKENNLFDFAFEIIYLLKDTKFIYLVRDGRDYACSMRKMPGGHFSYTLLATQWLQEQTKCLRVYHQLDKSQIILIRYRDLLRDPEKRMTEICQFLGVKFYPAMLEFYKQGVAKETADSSQYWANLKKPIIKQNFDKYMENMSISQIKSFESVAGNMLEFLEFDRKTDIPVSYPTPLKLLQYRATDYIISKIKKRKMFSEPNRKKRAQLIKDIEKKMHSNKLAFNNQRKI